MPEQGIKWSISKLDLMNSLCYDCSSIVWGQLQEKSRFGKSSLIEFFGSLDRKLLTVFSCYRRLVADSANVSPRSKPNLSTFFLSINEGNGTQLTASCKVSAALLSNPSIYAILMLLSQLIMAISLVKLPMYLLSKSYSLSKFLTSLSISQGE